MEDESWVFKTFSSCPWCGNTPEQDHDDKCRWVTGIPALKQVLNQLKVITAPRQPVTFVKKEQAARKELSGRWGGMRREEVA